MRESKSSKEEIIFSLFFLYNGIMDPENMEMTNTNSQSKFYIKKH